MFFARRTAVYLASGIDITPHHAPRDSDQREWRRNTNKTAAFRSQLNPRRAVYTYYQ